MLNEIYHSINPIAFSVGPIQVRWYGIAYLLGFVFACIVIWRLAKRWKVEFRVEELFVLILCCEIGLIVGARLGYVVFYGAGYYWQHPQEIFFVNQGGMSFHGGLIGTMIAGVIATRVIKVSYLTLADMVVVGAPIGLFFGRCANFINGELWGAPTDLPWSVIFGGSAGFIPRHPSQLYEAILEGIVIFVVLFALSRKRQPCYRGTYFGLFLILYSVFRFAVEFVREPDIQIGYLYGDWLTLGQVLSVPLFILGICVMVYAFKKKFVH